jgi:TPR repeat protein
MTCLLSILRQFETRYKMVLILTLGLILLVLASADKLYADNNSKAQMQYITGLKLIQDQSPNAATNHAKANIWFTMATYERHEGALFHLGVSYENGRGVQKDLRLAAHFYRLAAARHHVNAQYNLAVMMANGKSVKRDLEKALALILIAEQNTGLNSNAGLRLNQFQTAIEGMLNTAQISRTEWQVAKLFDTRI